MCFVWFNGQQLLLYIELDFINEEGCVYCAVRTVSLAKSASSRPVTAEVQVRSQSVHVRFVVDKVAL